MMTTNSTVARTVTTALFASVVSLAQCHASTTGSLSQVVVQEMLSRGAASSHAQRQKKLTSKVKWLEELSANVRRLLDLKAGWDGSGSVTISPDALFTAVSHVQRALDKDAELIAPRLVPGGDGSVQIEWHRKHGELELDIDRAGQLSIWIRDHRNESEFDAEGDEALALFYRWAPWVAAPHPDVRNAVVQATVPEFSVAA